MLDALAYLLVAIDLAAAAVNLRPAGDARPDVVAPRIERDALLVFMIVRQRERPRADQRHVAGEDIEELRNLVDVPAPQEAADAGQPRIVLGGLRNHRAVVERAHGAEFDDAEWLLIEAVAALHEEYGPWAVETYDCRDQQEEWRERDERDRGGDQVEGPLARDLEARQRPARQLQAGYRAEFRELYLFELVQDLLGADVDLDRQRHERLGAALDGLGLRPRQQQEDGVGLEAAHAGDGLGEIAIEHGVPRLGGGGGGNRGQEAAADDVDAVGPRLIAVDEAVDVGAGADQENALRRDQSGGARNRGDAHDEEAQADEADQRRGIEQHDPGARIFDAGLRQEADHQQADQRDVPHLNGAADVRLEPAEIRQPVFSRDTCWTRQRWRPPECRPA